MQQRTRRLSFNEEVLVAEYVKGSSGISQARATVPLVEMERRAKQRRAEEAAELQQHALLQAWVQLANQKPKSFLKPVAHASSRGGASAAAGAIHSLIASEMDAMNGQQSAQLTDDDGDAVVARRGEQPPPPAKPPPKPPPAQAAAPSAAASQGNAHAQARAALGGLASQLAGARRLLLRGADGLAVAQALHAVVEGARRMRRADARSCSRLEWKRSTPRRSVRRWPNRTAARRERRHAATAAMSTTAKLAALDCSRRSDATARWLSAVAYSSRRASIHDSSSRQLAQARPRRSFGRT